MHLGMWSRPHCYSNISMVVVISIVVATPHTKKMKRRDLFLATKPKKTQTNKKKKAGEKNTSQVPVARPLSSVSLPALSYDSSGGLE